MDPLRFFRVSASTVSSEGSRAVLTAGGADTMERLDLELRRSRAGAAGSSYDDDAGSCLLAGPYPVRTIDEPLCALMPRPRPSVLGAAGLSLPGEELKSVKLRGLSDPGLVSVSLGVPNGAWILLAESGMSTPRARCLLGLGVSVPPR
jgi:hypothetical protein